MLSVLLLQFSVFSTVSAMGVVLGVASLIVVLAVTSGFEREFQDKVLALNAHLIVIPYGNVDIDSPEADHIEDKLRGMPGVVRMAKFLFSAGEVMVGKVGANLKGIDLEQGADDLKSALIEGNVADLARPATCPGQAPGEQARAHHPGHRARPPHSRARRRLRADHDSVQPRTRPRRRRRSCSASSACSAWASTSTTRAWPTSASRTRTGWRARAARCSASSCASPTRTWR